MFVLKSKVLFVLKSFSPKAGGVDAFMFSLKNFFIEYLHSCVVGLKHNYANAVHKNILKRKMRFTTWTIFIDMWFY